METSLKLRDAAIENIKNYCKKYDCENDFDNIKNELIKQADEFNTSLPVDFYLSFYNLTTKLK
jgi:hypothetical protein